MSIRLPSDTNDDLPPDDDDDEAEDGNNSSESSLEEDDAPSASPAPIPEPKRPSGALSSAVSVPKRQRPNPVAAATESEPNPFELDSPAPVPPSATPLPNEQPNTPKPVPVDKCPICLDDFRYPVVACMQCEGPLCHDCLKKWSIHRNQGGGEEKVASCPRCRSTEGYKPHVYLNRQLGQVLVECERCKKHVAQDELKNHALERCSKRRVACMHRNYGCKWSGTHDVKDEHEQRCNYQNAAEVKAKLDAMKETFQQELLEMRRVKDQLTDDLESTIEKGRKKLEILTNTLSSLQQAVKCGRVAMFTKGRRNDTVSISVQSADRKSLDLQLKITVDEDKFYQVHAQFVDPMARFPIQLGTYFMNPSVPGIEGPCKHASYCFRLPSDSVEIYNELASWGGDRERALAERSRAIQFSICGGILLSGESRV